jgi:hypothetical protein
MDTPRRVLITTSATISFTISGTDWAGSSISETVTNSGSSVASVLSYATVTSITNSATASGNSIIVGTNGLADSPWVRADEWALGPTSVQCTVSGTVNYTVYFSNDDPNSPTNPVNPNAMTWVAASSPLATATATQQGTLTAPYLWTKTTLNSQTNPGYVTTTFVQVGVAPY